MSQQVAQSADLNGMSAHTAAPHTMAPSSLIARINNQTTSLEGYKATSAISLKLQIQKKEKAAGSTYDFDRFSTAAKPALCMDDGYIAFGTDEPEATQHFLSIIDGERLTTSAVKDPLVCYVPVPEHMSDVKWLNSHTLLAATGKGNLKLFEFKAADKALRHIGDMTQASNSYIREMAINPLSANKVAIGGFDGKLNFLDLSRPDCPYVERLDMQSSISSAKWSSSYQDSCVSCCLDEGKFYLFDTRTSARESAYFLDLQKQDLFTHERYNDTCVLLGFGDGHFKHIDMRAKQPLLHEEQDPYVEAIGNIEFNTMANAFVISGYTDVSVWKLNNGEMKIWSHAEVGEEPRRGKGWACSAAWYDSTTIVSGDNAGGVNMFLQDFS